MINIKKIKFSTNNEILFGNIITTKKLGKPAFIFFHGAGAVKKESRIPFCKLLLEKEIPSFIFDFSGHGESTGQLQSSSLSKRVMEAKVALKMLNQKLPITICASSMGGYVAIKLTETEEIKNLILMAPAVYDKKAYDVPFTDNFSEIIRRQNSWQSTDIKTSLRKFRGNLLIIIGENDEVIARNVIKLIDDNSINVIKKEIIVIPNASHDLFSFFNDNPKTAKMIIEKIIHLQS